MFRPMTCSAGSTPVAILFSLLLKGLTNLSLLRAFLIQAQARYVDESCCYSSPSIGGVNCATLGLRGAIGLLVDTLPPRWRQSVTKSETKKALDLVTRRLLRSAGSSTPTFFFSIPFLVQ
jgi:hypothetical protein